MTIKLKNTTNLSDSAQVDQQSVQPFTRSQKIYVQGSRPDILVPMREISLDVTPTDFGGEVNAPFAGPYTNAFHLDTPANDIMAGSLSFSDALLDGAAGPRFNQLEQAFLHGRTFLK